MSETTGAILAFGLLAIGAVFMFAMEQRGIVKRREARGGRDVDVSDLIAFGSKAGARNKPEG